MEERPHRELHRNSRKIAAPGESPPVQQVDQLMTVKEAAVHLRMSASTLYHWIHNGKTKLPFVKISRSVRFVRSELDAWIQKNAKRRMC